MQSLRARKGFDKLSPNGRRLSPDSSPLHAENAFAAADARGTGAHGLQDRAAILETVRTGASGIGRGERILRV